MNPAQDTRVTRKTLLIGWFEPEHYDKATGDFFQRLSFAPAIVDRRIADAFAEQRTERTQTLKAHLKTDIRHAQAPGSKQFFGFVNSPPDQVLVRRGIERVAKQTQKMVSRETSLLGYLGQIEWQVVALVNEPPGPTESFIKIRGFGLCFFEVVHCSPLAFTSSAGDPALNK